ncbi:MAG: hypothetical protein EPO20_06505 [Betaproteobacteria bacterium]|nr:MAG: hypothetical protein EPO20_06505 [Betaproteobacteria bacterium]
MRAFRERRADGGCETEPAMEGTWVRTILALPRETKEVVKSERPLSGPFEAACRSGRFVVTAEITPPDSAAPAPASCFASPAITCARVFSSAQPRTRSLAHVPGVHIPEPLLAEIIDLASFGRDHEGKRTAVA